MQLLVMADVRFDLPDPKPIREIPVPRDRTLSEHALASDTPFVVRGLAVDWPLVQAGRQSGQAARDYLLARHRDVPFTVSIGPRDQDGRIFYRDDMQMNVQTGRAKLPDIFARIADSERDAAETIYLASIDMKGFFTGLHEDNFIDLDGRDPLASIWIGTRTRIAAHNDFPDNLACVAAGRRRFTLFPPDQFVNLYLGPLDNTPAGRAVSMVDFAHPDLTAHPRFADAMAYAQSATLEPGDAIFIPGNWWHHIEGLDPFNILVNYWWRDTPRHRGQPQDALTHAIMAIRDLPANERAHWREMFAHYVFEADDAVTGHIPEDARGILGPMTRENSGKVRSYLLKALNR